ncbi:rhamnulokinase [Nakamurella flavida]|uniref:Rhamnulokinase n=1 Tax=Nakamurella flavida TaxID=363630 RepID=A0A939C2G6_9ACTN|nr:rhamnulokinase family protein [Nakamurella flavida]MBM9476550.1 rhamnulokinase [Nakamurella flavida]MDP9779012.1 rhamnulokinase [Nakamurella flavida]
MTAETGIALAAVDLGASSGRVMLGRITPGVLELTEVHRFRNGPVALPDGLYWDVLGLYQDALVGLRAAARRAPELAGVAIDSWAVDYGLVDASGRLSGNPFHYRDARTAAGVAATHERVDFAELYGISGLQFLPFTTLYQFAADVSLGRPDTQALLIPDLLGYWLTGVRVAEQTNASTTGLLDARTGDWSTSLIDRLGLPAGLLPDVVPPGTVLGGLTPAVVAETGLTRPLTVSTVGSHDTASAVLGVPAADADFGYISCGTWGLVGVELEAPVLTEAGRTANFTNERGVDGTVRYLRNVMGLWLLSESLRTWGLQGVDVSLPDVLARAAELPAGGPQFDPDDPVFLPPGDMPARIADACRSAGERAPDGIPAMVRCILDSLATAFAAGIERAAALSGRDVTTVHVVGGGSQNELLCQLVADACGRPVVAGPVEATALGNLLVQARTHGVLSGDRWALREHLRTGLTTRTYPPRRVPSSRVAGIGR